MFYHNRHISSKQESNWNLEFFYHFMVQNGVENGGFDFCSARARGLLNKTFTRFETEAKGNSEIAYYKEVSGTLT